MSDKKPEILAPVGHYEGLASVIKAGADAIYMGVGKINQRALKSNFTIEDVKEIRKITQDAGVRQYIVLNSIVFEEDLPYINETLYQLKEIGVDAVIGWDMAVLSKSIELGMETHLSTMASVSNSQAAKFYEKLGVKRVVPAREVKLEGLLDIKNKTNLEVEIFIHGAMCMAVSGRCFLSHDVFEKSGNRGECYQVCRHEFDVKIVSKNTGTEFYLGSDYVLSARDLVTINFVDKLMWADSWKIEGRNKNADYAYMVTYAYREARDRILNGEWNTKGWKDLWDMLERVYHREWDSGFYFGEGFFGINKSIAKEKKLYVGEIIKYYPKISVAELKVVDNPISIGDTIHIIGKKTGLIRQTVRSMQVEKKDIKTAEKGMVVGLKTDDRVRVGDKVYLIKQVESSDNNNVNPQLITK
ncbi:putative protease [Persephonella hydrogeniphila]|uniref:Putative protease n=1 Tax=Persephonella hydrogeniphila TaxID=198703 RepID=A0A285MZA2_9AQUI|nr:peptidase U32 family protein [Persephonella hydrogeniphila]SNZ02529.1 putative protease [Persephonella hydrogeniphila]